MMHYDLFSCINTQFALQILTPVENVYDLKQDFKKFKSLFQICLKFNHTACSH